MTTPESKSCFDKMEEYNKEVESIIPLGFHALNRFVMDHTQEACMCEELTVPTFDSIMQTQVHYDPISLDHALPEERRGPQEVIFSGKRSLQAAEAYKGKKVMVLDFANNHKIGGSPWFAGAQEESICRITNLYPCLRAKYSEYYLRHQEQFSNGELTRWGNDDIMYIPDVVVFKTSESAPKMKPLDQWFNVDILVCAAPELPYDYDESEYYACIRKRIDAILEIAKRNEAEVLILGAFGCGAFHNPPELVARAFKEGLTRYHFDTVEFAIYDRQPGPDSNLSVFQRVFAS